MTKAEFLEKLRTGRSVSFGESVLEAPTVILSTPLVDSLGMILDDEELLRFGAETTSFRNDWAGQLTWLLVLRRHLLVLTALVEKDPSTQEAKAFKIKQSTYPLNRVACGTIDLDYTGRFELHLSRGRLVLNVEGQEIEVSGKRITPKGIGLFLRAVVEGQSEQGAPAPAE